MLSADEESCRIRLERWRDRLETVMDLYPRSGLVSRSQLEEIRSAYAGLKQALQQEHHVLSDSQRVQTLTAAERHWYQPVIREAFIHLIARTNDTAAHIHSSLFDAYTAFEEMLAQFETRAGTP